MFPHVDGIVQGEVSDLAGAGESRNIMQIDMCGAGVLEKVDSSNETIQVKLDEVLRSKLPFHVNVNMVADLVRAHPEIIGTPLDSFRLLDQLIGHLESRMFLASDAERVLFDLQRSCGNVKLLNDAYCAWETTLEQIFAKRLCSGVTSSLYDYRLNNRFQRLLERETSMLRSRSHQRALFVGSGPFPITAVWLHRILSIPVDCLDISLDAANSSRQLLVKLGLSQMINVIHDGSPSYDVSSYDIIVIALLAKPKQAILNNIYESAKDDCEIICRTSFGVRGAVYEPTIITNEILEKFTVEDARVIAGASDDTISSILFKKARGSKLRRPVI